MIDLNQADANAIKALARLREPGWEGLLKLLHSELEEAKRKLVLAGDMVIIHRLQGRVEALQDLLRAAEESAKVVNRN